MHALRCRAQTLLWLLFSVASILAQKWPLIGFWPVALTTPLQDYVVLDICGKSNWAIFKLHIKLYKLGIAANPYKNIGERTK